MVAAAKDERAGTNTKQVWIYTSTDGGQTWINQIFPLSPTSPFSSDPVVSFSDDGQCYVTALPYGGGGGDGVQVARSLDGGITFSPGVHLPGTNGNSDKEWTWVDNYPSSPFYHRIYTAYMNFSPGFRVDYSTDRGLTWTLSPLSQSAFQFPMPIAYPDGQVQTIFAFLPPSRRFALPTAARHGAQLRLSLATAVPTALLITPVAASGDSTRFPR